MTNTVNCRYCKGQGTVVAEHSSRPAGLDALPEPLSRAVCTNCHRASRWLDQHEWRGVGFHSGQLRAPEPAEPVVDEGPEYEGQPLEKAPEGNWMPCTCGATLYEILWDGVAYAAASMVDVSMALEGQQPSHDVAKSEPGAAVAVVIAGGSCTKIRMTQIPAYYNMARGGSRPTPGHKLPEQRPAGAVQDLGQCTACGKLIDKGLHPGGKCVQCEHPVGYHPVLGSPIQPQPLATPTDLITIKQAADLAGRHPNTISTRINLGDIKAWPNPAAPAHSHKRQRLVSEAEIRQLYGLAPRWQTAKSFSQMLHEHSARVLDDLKKATR